MRVILIDGDAEPPEQIKRSVRDTLRAAARELELPAGDVVLRFVREDEMRALNQTWRDKDKPTDVLSFPMNADTPDGRRHIGDIALCLSVAARQAALRRASVADEAAVLAVHGLLHLLGYDHETDDGEMDALERDLRPKLGIGS